MKITALLADAGQSDPAGKTHVLGLGWTVTDAPTPQPMAVVVLVNFEDQSAAEGQHQILLRLVNDDGSPVTLPESGEAITLKAGVVLEPRPDTVPDAPAVASLVVNVGPGLPLKPGRKYRWEAELIGHPDGRTDVTFATRNG